MQTAGSRIRELREKKGWPLQTLADLVGVSKATMSRTENGRIPSDQEIEMIAEVLGTDHEFLISAFDSQREIAATAKALLTTGGLFDVLALFEDKIDAAELVRMRGLPFFAVESVNKTIFQIESYLIHAAAAEKPLLERVKAKALIVRAACFTMTIAPSGRPPHLDKHVRLKEIQQRLPYLGSEEDGHFRDLGIALPAMVTYLRDKYAVDVWQPSDLNRLSGAYVRGLILRDQITLAALKKDSQGYKRCLQEAKQMAKQGLLDLAAHARVLEGQAMGMIYLGLPGREEVLSKAEKFYRKAELFKHIQPFIQAQIIRTRIYHLIKLPNLDVDLVYETAKSGVHQLQVQGFRRQLSDVKRYLQLTDSKALVNLAMTITV